MPIRSHLNPLPGDPGYLKHMAATRFLHEIQLITGTTDEEGLILIGLITLCGVSEASGHEMPGTVKKLLEALSEEAKTRGRSAG
jgi:hypothetical protein